MRHSCYDLGAAAICHQSAEGAHPQRSPDGNKWCPAWSSAHCGMPRRARKADPTNGTTEKRTALPRFRQVTQVLLPHRRSGRARSQDPATFQTCSLTPNGTVAPEVARRLGRNEAALSAPPQASTALKEQRSDYHGGRGCSMNSESCALPASVCQDNEGVAERYE